MSSPLTKRYEDALVFAKKVHEKQRRKGTEIPYISHLMAVSSLVLEAGGGEDEAIGGLLHDSIEDCPRDYPGGVAQLRCDISDKFGQCVLEIVEHCSDCDADSKSQEQSQDKIEAWRNRKLCYIASISSKPENALIVSCADKLHNSRSILADYRHHGEDIWKRFTPGRETLWYYDELVKAFKTTKNTPIFLLRELEVTVSTLHNIAGYTDKQLHD